MIMNVLTKERMEEILDAGTIDQCTEEEKQQVMVYAFGEEFMASQDKGCLKEYVE